MFVKEAEDVASVAIGWRGERTGVWLMLMPFVRRFVAAAALVLRSFASPCSLLLHDFGHTANFPRDPKLRSHFSTC